jgi:hypothetical protein
MSAATMNGAVADPITDFGRHLAGLPSKDDREAAVAKAKLYGMADASEEALNEPRGLLSKRMDLGKLLRDGVPPVEYMPGEFARRTVYAEGVTGFTGHPEAGKTTFVCRLAMDAMKHGRHVVYLDFENGENDTVRRFQALGADADLLSEFLVYIPFPGPPNWDEIGTVWDEFPNAVGVWDSTRGVLRSLGLDEDRASEVVRFMDPLVEFALSRKVPCLLIDHVTKAATSSSGYARGSGDKLAAVQAQWYVDRVRPFSESEVGEIELTRWKARSGGLSRTHRFEVGDGHGLLTFRRLDPDQSPEGKVDQRIIEFLKSKGSQTCSQNDVESGVEGTGKLVRDRLKALAEDPQRPVRIDESGQHRRYGYDVELDREVTAELEF